MSRRSRDPIERIIELYSGLSPFDRGRVAQAFIALDGGKALAVPEPRRAGRPAGSRNRGKGNGVAEEGAQA